MKMEWEIVQQFIKPELLVLVVVLYFIGLALKSAAFVPDKHIPLVLGIIGILLALLYLLAVSELTGQKKNRSYSYQAYVDLLTR